jgi:hypothetical protein
MKALMDKLHAIRSSHLYWLIIGLTLLHIIPIWAFRFFPSQDGPSHIENSYMLLHYFDRDRPYSRYYDLNLDPVPNWFSHLAMAFLMSFLPPIAVEKLLLTAYIILFVASILYLLNSVEREGAFFSLLAFPFIYNYLLHMGFYNFSLSFPLMFLSIGYWWRRRDRWRDWQVIVGLNLLLILIYFCHIVSQLLAIMAILLLALLHHRRKIHRALFLVLALIPSYLLPFYYVYTRGTRRSGRWPSGDLWGYFAKIGSLTSYDLREYHLGRALAILFAALVIYTIVWEKTGLIKGRLRPQIGLRDGFLLLAVVFFLLYFYMPDGMSGGGFITTRLNLYPFIIILPWLSPYLWRPVKYGVGVIAIVLTLIHLGFTTYYYDVLNKGLEEYTSGIPFVGENETILPLSFDHRGRSARIGIYLHAKGYYCAEAGAIMLANYEGSTDYFPLKWKPSMNPHAIIGDIWSGDANIHPESYPEPIDYVLLWSPKDKFPALDWIQRNYELIHSQGRLRLYKRTTP